MTNVRQAVGLVKFTRSDKNVYVNLDRITWVEGYQDGSMIHFGGTSPEAGRNFVQVDQTPARVAALTGGAVLVAEGLT